VSGRRTIGLLAAGLVVVLAAGGCGAAGTTGQSGVAGGRQLFQTSVKGKLACSFCHTLKAAEADGPFGPDLDNIAGEDRAAGLSTQWFRRFVRHQIRVPQCLDPHEPSRCMPANLYTGADADAVTAFIVKCAGRAGTRGCEPVAGGLEGEARSGEHFYAQLGCVGCHWTNGNETPLAPSFNGLYGSTVTLADGTTAVADDGYLLESILAPDAKIVDGFPAGAMSARVTPGEISLAQAKALIAYIKTLK